MTPHDHRPSFLGCFLKLSLAFLVVALLLCVALYRVYGVDSYHESRDGIWPVRGRALIPPAASEITLQRDLLDHFATYTIAEEDLNAFLDARFAFNGSTLDSFSERSAVDPESIGKTIGRLGWVVPEETVVYSYAARNGGVSTYYHDPSSGRTYQISAYW